MPGLYGVEIVRIALLFVNAIGLWFVVLINSHKTDKKISNLFSTMVILMFIWVNLAYFSRILDIEIGIKLIRIAWSVTPLFFTIILYFILEFLGEKKKIYQKIKLAFLLISILFVFITLFTSAIIDKIYFVDQILQIEYGILSWVFFGTVCVLSFLNIFLLLRKRFSTSENNQKFETNCLLVGFSSFFLLNGIYNIILPVFYQRFNLYYLGDYSTIILISFIAYAILKAKLFKLFISLPTLLMAAIFIILFTDLIFLTPDPTLKLIKLISLLTIAYISYLLMKSVQRQTEQREEIEQLVQRLEKANKDLRMADKTKSEFISIASHQLRTPLTSTKGYLSMIADGTYGKVPPKIKEKIDCVFYSNERLIKLVNELLNVSRIEAGKIKYEPEKKDLEKILYQIIQDFRIVAKEKGLTIKFKKPKEKLPEMLLDEDKLRQVILNIIDNGIKYTNKGGITVSLEKKDNNACIAIADTGEGIRKEDLEKMFQSFSRGSTGVMLSREGAGLGLYIAKKFIEMHDGKIWAESKGLKKGSQFYIQIPIK
jgi:signal transduction histidine kinase